MPGPHFRVYGLALRNTRFPDSMTCDNQQVSKTAPYAYYLRMDTQLKRRQLLERTAAFCLATAAPRILQASGPSLTEVYHNNDFQLTGISVSKTGRLFINFPRWSPEYLNAVIEVMPDGSAKPFPDEDWNRWDLTPPTASKHFVCVQ